MPCRRLWEQRPTAKNASHADLVLDVYSNVPLRYVAASGICSWLLLAGYLISPSTYASIQRTDVLDDADRVTKSLFQVVRNVPLLIIASIACGVSSLGLAYVSFVMWRNPVWVKRYTALPVLMNSTMGLVSTLLNVYGIQGGNWSITAVITGSIILAWLIASGALYLYLQYLVIRKLRQF